MANTQLIQVCEVISVDDPEGCDRIKVMMFPVDANKKDLKDIPFVFPLLPKMFFTKPKVGEAVIVLTASLGEGNSQRYYIGPLVPQVSKMDNNMFKAGALSYMGGSKVAPLPSPYKDPSADGVFPENGDVSLIGRNNTDITLKDSDIRIRCGAKKENPRNESGLEFNHRDPAVITMKYDDDNKKKDGERSSVNIIADKINLIGTQSPDPSINLDKNEIINDEEFDKFLEEGHKLPYGDFLVDFLKKFRSAFLHHTHPFSMMPPCMETECLGVSNYDLDSILSDSVRIS